jgi:hypothetical protein
MPFNVTSYCSVRESKHAAMSVAHQIPAGLDAKANTFSRQLWIVGLLPPGISRDVVDDLVRPYRAACAEQLLENLAARYSVLLGLRRHLIEDH